VLKMCEPAPFRNSEAAKRAICKGSYTHAFAVV
jgi:hypothetical protein